MNNNDTNFTSLQGLRNTNNNTFQFDPESGIQSNNAMKIFKPVAELGGDTAFGLLSSLTPGSLSLDDIGDMTSDLSPADMMKSPDMIALAHHKYGISKGSFQVSFVLAMIFYMISIGITIWVYRSFPIKTQSPYTKRQFFEIIIGSLLIIFFYGFIRSILFGYPLLIKEALIIASLYIIGYLITYRMMYQTYKDANQVMH